jgi:hypothetical protein
VKAKATLTFNVEVEVEDGDDVKRLLREEAVQKISPPFGGWTIEVEQVE